MINTLTKTFILSCSTFLLTVTTVRAQAVPSQVPDKVTFYGSEKAAISAGVVVPAGKAYYYASGIGAPLLNPDAPVGSPERYGDTKTQAIGVMNQIRKDLQVVGLDLKDVAYLRVYVAQDRNKENKPDFKGWFDAYAQFFGTAQNPIKVARSTVGVVGLVNPDWLIEIEAVAVFPGKPAKASASAN